MVKLHSPIKEATIAADEDVRLGMQKSRERDETQRGIDDDMAKAKAAWEAAGKHSHAKLTATDADGNPSAEFKAAHKAGYWVDKTDRTLVKGMIRRAGTLHDGVPVYAEDKTGEKGTPHAGLIRVAFTYAPKPPKAEATEAPATNAQAGDAGDAGNPGEQSSDQTSDASSPTRRGVLGRNRG